MTLQHDVVGIFPPGISYLGQFKVTVISGYRLRGMVVLNSGGRGGNVALPTSDKQVVSIFRFASRLVDR